MPGPLIAMGGTNNLKCVSLASDIKGFEWEEPPPEYSERTAEREQPAEDGAAAPAAAAGTEVAPVSVIVIRNSRPETENGTSERCDFGYDSNVFWLSVVEVKRCSSTGPNRPAIEDDGEGQH